MKTIKFILAFTAILSIVACKKKITDGDYFYGTWHVREQQYTSPDTTYTNQLPEGNLTYNFKTNTMVDIVSPGIATITDSWEVIGVDKDSVNFGTQADWQILESQANHFEAKFYTDASSYFVFRLER